MIALTASHEFHAAARRATDPVPPESTATVLLLEDEPAISRMLVRLFAQSGMRTVVAENRVNSLELLARSPDAFALVFVDCHAPSFDHAEFCHQVRIVHPQVPVLVATGAIQPNDVTVREGLTVLVPRPYLPTDLVWTARQLLGRMTG